MGKAEILFADLTCWEADWCHITILDSISYSEQSHKYRFFMRVWLAIKQLVNFGVGILGTKGADWDFPSGCSSVCSIDSALHLEDSTDCSYRRHAVLTEVQFHQSHPKWQRLSFTIEPRYLTPRWLYMCRSVHVSVTEDAHCANLTNIIQKNVFSHSLCLCGRVCAHLLLRCVFVYMISCCLE